MSLFDTIKRIKLLHWIYNVLHYNELKHNKAAFKRYQLNKNLFDSISSKDFPDKQSRAWLDIGESSVIAATKDGFESFPKEVQEKILRWSDKGYMILDGFLSEEKCDKINQDIDEMLKAKKLHFVNKNKLMFAFKKSGLLKDVVWQKELIHLLSVILDKDVVPFQTINFITGSQQRAHSDSIHMTTYPLGYLIAVWIALEDVNEKNGPLFYYEGSHKLPYLLNNGFNEGDSALLLGKKDYKDYEDVLEEMVKKAQFSKKEFYAKKGDIFIWHANLVHGGAPIIDLPSTRKSMVIHYYAKDVIKYHEITERPSLMSVDK